MTSKFRNKIKQVLYRPAKKHPHLDAVVKKLSEAEKALNSTVGGALNKKPKKKTDKKDEKKDEKKDGEKKD